MILLLVTGLYWGWKPLTTIRHDPGILVSAMPVQESVPKQTPWMKDAYQITPLARFRLDALLIDKEYYRFDGGAAIAPIDLLLGWQAMSNQAVLDGLRIHQGGRYWRWYTRGSNWPAAQTAIETGASNMHIIPANDAVEKKIRSFRRGAVVHLSGYLVRVNGPNGFTWKTSLSRSDTGDGACELFWVEEARLADK